MIGKGIKFFILTLLAYLLQATLASDLAISDVAPNFAIAFIAVISVAMGRKYTFVMSLAIGYLMEIMMPALDYIYLILYPVCAMLGSLAFSDKTERRMEEERSSGKKPVMIPAQIRTMLCALVSMIVYEGVHVLYVYLSGITITSTHYSRMIISLLYTTMLAGVVQFPIRYWLKIHKLKKAR